VSPNPVKASDFYEIISKIQENQIFLKIGSGFMKLAIGDFTDTINDSNGVIKPQKLQNSGYPFMNPGLEDTVRLLLGHQIENKTQQGLLDS
jgi:NAD dependent epimerase/dehydratase family enzyme